MTIKELMRITGKGLWIRINMHGDYIAGLEDTEIKDGIVLVSSCGNGGSINGAIASYCRKISNKLIVTDAFKDYRKEYNLLEITP